MMSPQLLIHLCKITITKRYRSLQTRSRSHAFYLRSVPYQRQPSRLGAARQVARRSFPVLCSDLPRCAHADIRKWSFRFDMNFRTGVILSRMTVRVTVRRFIFERNVKPVHLVSLGEQPRQRPPNRINHVSFTSPALFP